MIWKEIPLDISKKDENILKDLNKKVIDHLDEHHPLKVKVWDDLVAALSGMVSKNSLLLEVLQEVDAGSDHYLLRLTHGDNEILNLPWAAATDRVSGKKLGELSQLHLARSLPGRFQETAPWLGNTAPPLKILVMISSPEDAEWSKVLSYDQEERHILEAFGPLLQKGLVEIDFTGDGSLEALADKLKRKRYHVLHFSGHGVYSEGTGYLELENPVNLKRMTTPAEEFADTLNRKPQNRPPLVVLSSCQTAQGETEAGLRGVTNQLLKKGIPAVIAMGMSISDSYASQFSAHFYRQLAEKEDICTAFKAARNFLKDKEYQDLTDAKVTPAIPLQWHIPSLYLQAPLEHLVNWDLADETLNLRGSRYLLEKGHLILDKSKDHLFIGRRKDKALILKPFFDKKPVLLKGQGGVGKTALAIHLLHRLLARSPETTPFAFDETTRTLQEIIENLKKFLLEQGDTKNYVLVNQFEKGLDQFSFLVFAVAEHCKPVFLFDNLEDFQSQPGEEFAPEFQDISDAVTFLISCGKFPLLLTCRYPLKGFANLHTFDLNQVGLNDFWKRCLYLDLGGISKRRKDNRHKDTNLLAPKKLEFIEVVKLLHGTFGGNHRALEFFDSLVTKQPDKLAGALESLEVFQKKFHAETEQVRVDMGKDLVFSQLMALIEPDKQQLLRVLSCFRVPVQTLALELQSGVERNENPLGDRLADLRDLTLVEITLDRELDNLYYYVTPIVKDLLADKVRTQPFSPHQAGVYYYHQYHNQGEENSQLEEAFHHYYQAETRERVAELGAILSSANYNYSLYANAFFYAQQTHKLLGDNTGPDLLNRLGLIYDLYGDYKIALERYQQALEKYKETGHKKGEGATLNNIGQIFRARGDYDTALTYLEQSLEISRQICDKSCEGTTLNNISGIFQARGDYDSALTYLEQSLEISREIGDKSGEGATLNNIATIYYTRGDIDGALKYMKQSLEIRREIGDKSGEGTTLNNISQIYKARRDYDTALKHLEQCLSIFEEIGDKSHVGGTLNNISQIYKARGDYDSTLKYLEQCLSIFEEIGDKSYIGGTLNNISQIFKARGDYDSTITYLEQSLEIRREIGDKKGEAYTLFNLFMTCKDEKVNRKEEAAAFLQEVIEINKTLKDAQITAALKNYIEE